MTKRVGSLISQIHSERIIINQHRILYPIGNSIKFWSVFHYKSIGFIEVKALNLRHHLTWSAEEYLEHISFLAFNLKEETVCLFLNKLT